MQGAEGAARFDRVAPFVLTAAVTAVTIGLVGIAFPLLYEVRETTGATAAVAWALAGFVLGPLAGAAADRLAGRRRTVAAGVVVLGSVRLFLGWTHPIPLWLPIVGVAAGLIALGALATGRRHRPDVAVAILVGVSVDAGIRAAYQTWDPAWRATLSGNILAVVAGVVLLGALLAELRGRASRVGASGSIRTGTVLGPFLLLQVLFLQNLAFQTSEAGFGLPLAFVTSFVADLVALGIVVGSTRRGPPWLPWAAAVTVVAGTTVLALTSLVVPAVIVTQAAAAILLAWAICRPAERPAWRTLVGVASGMLVFVAFAFAYQIDVTTPLPVPRATWPIAAGVLVAVLGLTPARPAMVRVSWWVLAVPVVALAIALVAWPTYGSRPAPITPGGDAIVQWNIHTALNADGQIDPETIARTIESVGANVVVLEEVGRGWPIAGQVDELSWLERRLDMHVAWASAGDDQFGNAILSTYPLANLDVLHLPFGAGPQHRSALRVELPDGLWIVGAHLEGHTVETRTDQAAAILDRWGEHVLVVAGDLNMQPGQPDEQLYVEAGLESVQDTLGDPNASTARDPAFPGDRVDWIWVSSTGLEAQDFAIVQSPASDHLPLLVSVRVPGSGR